MNKSNDDWEILKNESPTQSLPENTEVGSTKLIGKKTVHVNAQNAVVYILHIFKLIAPKKMASRIIKVRVAEKKQT